MDGVFFFKSPECLGHCLVGHAEPARDRAGRHAETTQDVCPFSYLLVDEGLGLARVAAKAADQAAAAQRLCCGLRPDGCGAGSLVRLLESPRDSIGDGSHAHVVVSRGCVR